MITFAQFIDAVTTRRMRLNVKLSPEAMAHAERFFRTYAEELAEHAIRDAVKHFSDQGRVWSDAPYASRSRQERLERHLTDTQPLIDPLPDNPSSQ